MRCATASPKPARRSSGRERPWLQMEGGTWPRTTSLAAAFAACCADRHPSTSAVCSRSCSGWQRTNSSHLVRSFSSWAEKSLSPAMIFCTAARSFSLASANDTTSSMASTPAFFSCALRSSRCARRDSTSSDQASGDGGRATPSVRSGAVCACASCTARASISAFCWMIVAWCVLCAVAEEARAAASASSSKRCSSDSRSARVADSPARRADSPARRADSSTIVRRCSSTSRASEASRSSTSRSSATLASSACLDASVCTASPPTARRPRRARQQSTKPQTAARAEATRTPCPGSRAAPPSAMSSRAAASDGAEGCCGDAAVASDSSDVSPSASMATDASSKIKAPCWLAWCARTSYMARERQSVSPRPQFAPANVRGCRATKRDAAAMRLSPASAARSNSHPSITRGTPTPPAGAIAS
mmetsp:Transcript_19964/g.67591  ORF Transcript_19964/g.67591 Transcript_19964/m.67591 type:complete len:419 (-) Transcript_19964:204-1460(-)